MHLPHERSSSDHRTLGWRWPWWKKDDSGLPEDDTQSEAPSSPMGRKKSRKVIPGLPRPGTFKRQQSELRVKLEPVQPHFERRALSVDPRRNDSDRGSSRIAPSFGRTSAPVLVVASAQPCDSQTEALKMEPTIITEAIEPEPESKDNAVLPLAFHDVFEDEVAEELEKRWILNLSMHFRDRSNREKFFVTFAETPTHWRRVTISLDYRNAAVGSLEADLQHTQYQRDKSAKIYDAIRDSLPDIHFYDTVTNLKLATEEERLHVHVTEDINEVIHFPPVAAIAHLSCPRVKEEDIVFDCHLSGFVYKVVFHGQTFIKKEIPGPDTTEEFLYEVNALNRLSGSNSVIQFGGVITDNEGRHLKGLLISYAGQGALIDVLYDGKRELSWPRRERWAKQIVQGLSEIHEAGFVQGDFTLSNIVIDCDDEAKIIDINRRGCPVGWEPPEIAALIDSKQRVAMYIGVKSDIFQLGMVLWAIAMQEDEPEIQSKPLTFPDHRTPDDIPSYYKVLVSICLSDNPRTRGHTEKLLSMFPELEKGPVRQHETRPGPDEHHYIDPENAVERDDIDRFRRLATSQQPEHTGVAISAGTHTYVNAPTDMSGEPYYLMARGRSPTRYPTEDADRRYSSHASPLHEVPRMEYNELELQDEEPVVVEVSPDRHYLECDEVDKLERAAENPDVLSNEPLDIIGDFDRDADAALAEHFDSQATPLVETRYFAALSAPGEEICSAEGALSTSLEMSAEESVREPESAKSKLLEHSSLAELVEEANSRPEALGGAEDYVSPLYAEELSNRAIDSALQGTGHSRGTLDEDSDNRGLEKDPSSNAVLGEHSAAHAGSHDQSQMNVGHANIVEPPIDDVIIEPATLDELLEYNLLVLEGFVDATDANTPVADSTEEPIVPDKRIEKAKEQVQPQTDFQLGTDPAPYPSSPGSQPPASDENIEPIAPLNDEASSQSTKIEKTAEPRAFWGIHL